MESFSSIMKLKAFSPFTNAEAALQNLNAVKNNEVSEDLSNFISSNIKKKKGMLITGKLMQGHNLAVQDKNLAQQVASTFGIECQTNEVIFELFRGIRSHFAAYIKQKDVKNFSLSKYSGRSTRPSWVWRMPSHGITWSSTSTGRTSPSFNPSRSSNKWRRTSTFSLCASKNGLAGMYDYNSFANL